MVYKELTRKEVNEFFDNNYIAYEESSELNKIRKALVGLEGSLKTMNVQHKGQDCTKLIIELVLYDL